jgi:hypothetical protein
MKVLISVPHQKLILAVRHQLPGGSNTQFEVIAPWRQEQDESAYVAGILDLLENDAKLANGSLNAILRLNRVNDGYKMGYWAALWRNDMPGIELSRSELISGHGSAKAGDIYNPNGYDFVLVKSAISNLRGLKS